VKKRRFLVDKSVSNPEMDRFNSALKSVMQVSKEDLKEILAREKAANSDKPKRGPKVAANKAENQEPNRTVSASKG
jgi:uncharacterized tellurite resistance protein B-like protein